MNPIFHVILFQPEIPQNTGNVGRLCAIAGARLHLVHPLGFAVTDRHLRRSGMDYWRSLDKREHADWPAFRADPESPGRIWLLSTRGGVGLWDAPFEPGDGLLFGNEGHGCPDWLHHEIGPDRRVRIPHAAPGLRSINLATSVGIVAYELLRRNREAWSEVPAVARAEEGGGA